LKGFIKKEEESKKFLKKILVVHKAVTIIMEVDFIGFSVYES